MEGMVGGTKCKKCKTGDYHFDRLIINRVDVGNGTKFLRFICNECGDIYIRPLELQPRQLKFIV